MCMHISCLRVTSPTPSVRQVAGWVKRVGGGGGGVGGGGGEPQNVDNVRFVSSSFFLLGQDCYDCSKVHSDDGSLFGDEGATRSPPPSPKQANKQKHPENNNKQMNQKQNKAVYDGV